VGWYGEVPAGSPCALVSSTGFLEVAVNLGRATDLYRASVGTPVTFTES
jgi:S-adenosylmethionine hydrolase